MATLKRRTESELSSVGLGSAAGEYLAATESIDNFNDLYRLTAEWVSMTHDLDLDDVADRAFIENLPGGDGDLQLLTEPVPVSQRWQYAVINVGSFNSPGRLAHVLEVAGAHGWELTTVYDKASNWISGMEKGFMLLKRPVPDGVIPKQWCIQFRN